MKYRRMPFSNGTIRAVSPADHDAWLEMWNAYCAFYGARVPDRVTACTWQRICAADSPIGALLAVDASPAAAAIGFAHYVVHPFTWGEQPCCYLEDLFVRPHARGLGAGRALIERLLALGRENGWPRVYWSTQETNAVARRLYDRFARRDDFVRYTVTLGERRENDEPGGV